MPGPGRLSGRCGKSLQDSRLDGSAVCPHSKPFLEIPEHKPGRGGHMARQDAAGVVGSSKYAQRNPCLPSAAVVMALAWILAVGLITKAQTLDTAILGIVSDPSRALGLGAGLTIHPP